MRCVGFRRRLLVGRSARRPGRLIEKHGAALNPDSTPQYVADAIPAKRRICDGAASVNPVVSKMPLPWRSAYCLRLSTGPPRSERERAATSPTVSLAAAAAGTQLVWYWASNLLSAAHTHGRAAGKGANRSSSDSSSRSHCFRSRPLPCGKSGPPATPGSCVRRRRRIVRPAPRGGG